MLDGISQEMVDDTRALLESNMTLTAVVKKVGVGGKLDVTDNPSLPCFLTGLNPEAAVVDRTELTQRRYMTWSLGYQMPPSARVSVGGRDWNVASGTRDVVEVLGIPIARRCELVAL